MADMTQLVRGLESYAAALERHQTAARSEFDTLKRSLERLSAVYEGAAATDFKAHWARSQRGLDDYINGAQKIRTLLQQRVELLRQADRSSGL